MKWFQKVFAFYLNRVGHVKASSFHPICLCVCACVYTCIGLHSRHQEFHQWFSQFQWRWAPTSQSRHQEFHRWFGQFQWSGAPTSQSRHQEFHQWFSQFQQRWAPTSQSKNYVTQVSPVTISSTEIVRSSQSYISGLNCDKNTILSLF